MELEYRTYDPSQIECRVRDKAQGIIEVRSNVCDQVDSYDSAFVPGVWDRAINDQGFLPYFLVDHDTNKQIGRLTASSERRDAAGIWQHSTVRLNLEKQLARETLSDIEERFREFYSHGFASDPGAEKYEQRDGRMVRMIGRLRLWPDVSSVLVPGGSGTATLAVRSSALLLSRPTDEHVCQVALGDDCTEFRSAPTFEGDKPYVTDYGHRAGAGWAVTAIHYPVTHWTVAEARAHALAHAGGEFAAAGERRDIRALMPGYTPVPYRVDPDENVTCPNCGRMNDDDALYCDQCGHQMGVRSGRRANTPEVRAVTEQAWDGSASRYADTNAYCKACLIDENEPGADKVQAMCHLPVYEPNGDLNANAVRAAAAALGGARGGVKASADAKAAAARKLDRLKKEAGIGEENQRSAAGTSEATSDALATETRVRLALARMTDLGVDLDAEVRHSALSKKSTNTLRQAHDAMAAAVPGFCPGGSGSGEPNADDTEDGTAS